MSTAPEKQKRRIMQRFTISEISAVDMPAQEGAKAMIVKRGDSEKIETDHLGRTIVKYMQKDEDAELEDAPVRKFTPVRDAAWKAERDALLKDVADAFREERAQIAEKREQLRKEMTMTFEVEVAKARASGKSGTAAMIDARRANPSAYEQHQAEGRQAATKANVQVTGNPVAKLASETLTTKARDLAARENISLTTAMQKARRDNPDLFELTRE